MSLPIQAEIDISFQLLGGSVLAFLFDSCALGGAVQNSALQLSTPDKAASAPYSAMENYSSVFGHVDSTGTYLGPSEVRANDFRTCERNPQSRFAVCCRNGSCRSQHCAGLQSFAGSPPCCAYVKYMHSQEVAGIYSVLPVLQSLGIICSA